ncbi:hypothetical protein [Microbacterium amylolyticum]|uniref:LppX_LprAFG lipoprotein n=1 Tax=Microbacterium amylolyticum TaxID=936337 RepID=A0ABS4ZHU5_9MICO|nr:hypothetical protein [Microbacterium amylolyticum]MBP2436854.1 hypothetical protein [Microbacterium amylolyticum]
MPLTTSSRRRGTHPLMPSRAGRVRRIVSIAILAATASVLLSCSPGEEAPVDTEDARTLTSSEAERLALARFLNFNSGVRSFSAVVTDSGTESSLTGWIDYSAGLGYSALVTREETSLIAWTDSSISVLPWTQQDSSPPLPPPGLADGAPDWRSTDLAPAESRLHTVLALGLSIVSDRPDNASLLQQTDARWLAERSIDGVTLDVFAGPTDDTPFTASSGRAGDGSDAVLRFWIDEVGLAHRVEARLGGSGEWTTIDFGDADQVSFAEDFLDSAR